MSVKITYFLEQFPWRDDEGGCGYAPDATQCVHVAGAGWGRLIHLSFENHNFPGEAEWSGFGEANLTIEEAEKVIEAMQSVIRGIRVRQSKASGK